MATNSDLRTIGLGFCWQDYEVGDRFQTIGRTVTEADLVNFINTTGMTEVMFNNLVYIEEKSAVKGRAIPGALVYSIAEGLLVQSTMQHTGLAFLNMELDVMDASRDAKQAVATEKSRQKNAEWRLEQLAKQREEADGSARQRLRRSAHPS
mgnify:CR=1 FL=1